MKMSMKFVKFSKKVLKNVHWYTFSIILPLHLTEIETEDDLRAKPLEVESVKLAEKGNLDQAIEKINEAIEISSKRPSCYNNRAQIYRLKGDLNSK